MDGFNSFDTEYKGIDTSNTPAPDYSPNNIPEPIKRRSTWVRGKNKLIAMREALGQGLEIAGITAFNAERIAQKTQYRQDAVEDFNNQVIQEMTDKDVISAPEIIEARFGKETLSAQLLDMIASILDSAISPDDYVGTDAQKVQQAIDQSIAQNRGIKFSRFYDITGSSLKINKQNGNGSEMAGARERSPMYFIGVGGGLKKNDSGFMFTSDFQLVGDLHFTAMKMYSVIGAETTVMDGDSFIRVFFNNCTFRNVDHIVVAVDLYLQSWHFNGGSVVGGNGWAIQTPAGFDVSFSGGFFAEQREHFFEQTPEAGGGFKKLAGFRVQNAMVEGLRGTAFYFRNTEGLFIDGLYLESNANTDIVFDPNGEFEGVRIENVRTYETPTSTKTSIIKWGGRLHSASTANINGKYRPIHDTTNVTNGVIYSDNDRSSDAGYNAIPDIDSARIIKKKSSRLVTSFANNIHSSDFEVADRFTFVSSAVSVPAKGVVEVEATMPHEVYRDDMLSTQTYTGGSSSHLVGVINSVINRTDRRKVTFVLYNFGDNLQNVTLYATLFNYSSVTG